MDMNGIDDFIFDKEFDNVEDLEIEERKSKYSFTTKNNDDDAKKQFWSNARNVAASLFCEVFRFVPFLGWLFFLAFLLKLF